MAEKGPDVELRLKIRVGSAAIVAAGMVFLSHPSVLGRNPDSTPLILVPRGARLKYHVVTATPPAAIAGRGGAQFAFGRPPTESPEPKESALSYMGLSGWQQRGLPTANIGIAPLGVRDSEGRCRGCATVVGDAQVARTAALLAEAEFVILPHNMARLTSLELRIRGHDGVRAWLNGRLVVQRFLTNDPLSPAVALRGPEWETFHIPATESLLSLGRNRLAVEVRPALVRNDVSLDLELTGPGPNALVRGPILQLVDDTSAVLLFSTRGPSQASVEVIGAQYPHRFISGNGQWARNHRVQLTGLPRHAGIRYRIVVDGVAAVEERFHTMPSANEPLRFAVYGDTRGGHTIHASLVHAILREAPDLVLSTGDLVTRGADEGDWQRFFSITAALMAQIPYYPAAGNHDLGQSGDERRRLSEIFAFWPGPEDRPSWTSWYAFDVAGVHFVMLDSNAYEHPAQVQWLTRDLVAAKRRGVRAIFVSTHDGPFSRGLHGGNRFALEHVVPILARHGVTMLFSGHDHLYQRGARDGLRYMVSGGGGAPLYSPRCGVSGRPRCVDKDGMEAIAVEYHYILVTVYGNVAEFCPRRPDGSALEPCTRARLSAP